MVLGQVREGDAAADELEARALRRVLAADGGLPVHQHLRPVRAEEPGTDAPSGRVEALAGGAPGTAAPSGVRMMTHMVCRCGHSALLHAPKCRSCGCLGYRK